MTIGNVSFTVALVLAALVLGFFALGGTLNLLGLTLTLSDGVLRSAVGFLAIGMIGAGVILERSSRGTVSSGSSKDHAEGVVSYFQLDDHGIESLSSRLEGAKRVTMLMRTGVSLFSQYEELFKSLLASGCEIIIVLCDPKSPVARSIYGSDDDSFERYFAATKTNINRISTSVGGGRFTVKTVRYAPTLSMMKVEKHKKADDFIQVTLLFTHARYGRDRPTFLLHPRSKWYEVFSDELDMALQAADVLEDPA